MAMATMRRGHRAFRFANALSVCSKKQSVAQLDTLWFQSCPINDPVDNVVGSSIRDHEGHVCYVDYRQYLSSDTLSL